MPQVKLTPLGAPPEPVSGPKAWPLKRLVVVTSYVAILTVQTLLLPFPFDALASIGLFAVTVLAMIIAERIKKLPVFFCRLSDQANPLRSLFGLSHKSQAH